MPLIEPKFRGRCRTCNNPHDKSTPEARVRVWWVKGTKGVQCVECRKGAMPDLDAKATRPGAQNKALPVDVLARGIADRVWLLNNGTPRPGDSAAQLCVDLGAVLGEYRLTLACASLTQGDDDPAVP